MTVGIPYIIIVLIIAVVIIAFFIWIIFSSSTEEPLPPFNPIPTTKVQIAEDGVILEALGPVFDTVSETDIYPDPPEDLEDRSQTSQRDLQPITLLYVDLEIVTIGETSGLNVSYDLKSVVGNTKSIYSNFTGKAGLKPVKIYYFIQHENSTEKVVINIFDNTYIRPGYNYISYFTTAIAPDQPNFSTAYSTTPFTFTTFINTTSSGVGITKGTVFEDRNQDNSLSIREKLLSTFRNTPSSIRQNYQLVSLKMINIVPVNSDVELLQSFNNNGAIISVAGRTEFIASAPCQ